MVRRIIEELKKKVHRKSGKKNNGKKVSRVLIAVPAYSHIENACVRSLFELEKPDGVEVGFAYSEGYTVALARNMLVAEALKQEVDYVLWIDADEIIPKDFLVRTMNILKEKEDAGMACGYYCKKIPGISITEMWGFTADGKGVENIKEEVLPKEGGVYEIQGCGLGCSLIPLDIIRKVTEKTGICFEYKVAQGKIVSEDLDFCNKVKALGYKIYADVGLKCPHIGKVAF